MKSRVCNRFYVIKMPAEVKKVHLIKSGCYGDPNSYGDLHIEAVDFSHNDYDEALSGLTCELVSLLFDGKITSEQLRAVEIYEATICNGKTVKMELCEVQRFANMMTFDNIDDEDFDDEQA